MISVTALTVVVRGGSDAALWATAIGTLALVCAALLAPWLTAVRPAGFDDRGRQRVRRRR